MKFLKYLGGPIIIAILACICQVVDQNIGVSLGESLGNTALVSGGWISFIGWACYFLAGCDVKGGVKVLVSTVLGIVASIVIIYCGANIFTGLGFWAFPVSVFLFVIPTICTEKISLNILPVLFITAGIFFSMPKDVTSISAMINVGIYEIVFIFFGCVLGYLTIIFRGSYDAKYNTPSE